MYNLGHIPEVYHYSITILLNAGFKPIAVSTVILEVVFYFASIEEAEQAFEIFGQELGGWWYCISDLDKNNEDYKKEFLREPNTTYFI